MRKLLTKFVRFLILNNCGIKNSSLHILIAKGRCKICQQKTQTTNLKTLQTTAQKMLTTRTTLRTATKIATKTVLKTAQVTVDNILLW